MTQTFRKTALATTMLAGLAIFSVDAAQAGPNGGPSLGSISGFSSMRMDFNRVGGHNRALSRNDLRVVPLDVVKTTEKPKDTKNVARVSNPKSSNGGKGKQDLGNGPNLHVPAALADAYRITGGNLGDLSRFDEFAKRLGLGPLVVADPLAPNNGGGDFPFPWPKTDQTPSDRNFVHGWSGYAGAPGGPDTSKTGQAAGDPWRVVGEPWTINGTTYTLYYNKERDTFQSEARNESTGDAVNTEYGPGERPGIDEGDTVHSVNMADETVVITAGEESGEEEDAETPENEKDSQPAGEGYGRPSNNGGGWCSPTGGCYRPARNGSPRIIPAETDGGGTVSARRQSPSWATDPSEEGYTGGSGNVGRTGYDPTQEGCDNPGACGDIGGPGGPGNLALEGLNAAH